MDRAHRAPDGRDGHARPVLHLQRRQRATCSSSTPGRSPQVEERTLDVTAETASRCVAGKSVLTVKVTNAETVPVTASVTTPYGSKSSVTVAAGKSVSSAFTTRLANAPAGTAEVSATATVEGEELTGAVQAGLRGTQLRLTPRDGGSSDEPPSRLRGRTDRPPATTARHDARRKQEKT